MFPRSWITNLCPCVFFPVNEVELMDCVILRTIHRIHYFKYFALMLKENYQ